MGEVNAGMLAGLTPLGGRSVVVTRASTQAAQLIADLKALGAEVVALPVIDFVDPPSFEVIDAAIAELPSYHWVVLSSTNGVERFLARLERFGNPAALLADTPVAAVGTATAKALERRGIRVALLPQAFDADGLAEALVREGASSGWRVLVPRALVGRDVLERELSPRGVEVVYAPVYQTVPAKADPATLERLRAGVDVVTFTSPSTVKHFLAFCAAAGIDGHALLGRAVVATIGPVTSEALRVRDVRVDVEPEPYTARAMVTALAEYFSAG